MVTLTLMDEIRQAGETYIVASPVVVDYSTIKRFIVPEIQDEYELLEGEPENLEILLNLVVEANDKLFPIAGECQCRTTLSHRHCLLGFKVTPIASANYEEILTLGPTLDWKWRDFSFGIPYLDSYPKIYRGNFS